MIRRRKACSMMVSISVGLLLNPFFVHWASAQSPFQNIEGPAPVRVLTGPRGNRIAVPVNRPPAEGDSIHVITNNRRIRTALILPDGRQVTEANSQSAGFKWMQFPNLVPLGSDDGGYQIEITFAKPAAAGGYAIQFTSDRVETGAFATAWFTSRMLEFEQLVQSLPGGQIAKPVPLSSGVPARIEVKTAVETAWLEVVVPNASVEVTLTLPSGRILQRGNAAAREWEVISDRDTGSAFLRGLLFPVKGTHHVIGLLKADPGTYLIRARAPAGTNGQLQAAFLPAGAAAAKSLARRALTGEPPRGEVGMQLLSAPQGGFVGDQVEMTVRLNGAVGDQPPELVVRTETQPYVSVVPTQQGGGRRLGPAGAVQTVPVTFHKDSDGTYRGALTLRDAGWTRVAVRAKGRKASGEPFDVEEVTNIPTNEIVARVAAFQAEGKDANQDGRFETLEVALDLDVVVPGSYMISAGVLDAAQHEGASSFIRQQLEKGRQRIVVHLPSGQIWNRLRSGPLNVVASLSLVLGGGSFVSVPGIQRRQIEYRREQWDPGAYHSEDTVTVHGIRPAASGRYGIAEVVWEASTPGGTCTWGGTLSDQKNGPSLYDRHSQTVPAGTRKFSFLFDGAEIAAAGTRDWTFEARVACGDRKDFATVPTAPLVLNSKDYETRPGVLQLTGQVVLSQKHAPQYWEAMLTAGGDGAESAQFEVTKLPTGWKGNFYPLLHSRNFSSVNLIVETPPGASPGRYFLEVTAAEGAERVSREFVVELLDFIQ